VREEFYIERQGKRMVLYAGLLAEAHDRGLHEIDTELLQIPDESNGNVAIVRASVAMKGGDNTYPTYTGIGDASPQNVGRNIAPHLIRMAETRAKARALRDAVNVGASILEEAGGEQGPESRQAEAAPRPDTDKTPGGASKKAAGKLWHLVGGREGADQWQDLHGNIKEMSAKQVSDHIDELTV
jgi:hypothetical protein